MTIENQLNDELKANMRAKNADVVACIRQLKSKVQEATNAKDFAGEVNDALYQQVIASYVKSLQKAIGEMESAGDRSQAIRAKYTAEIGYLNKFMPKMLDEAATRTLVRKAIETSGVTDAKQSGKVLGALMKQHKGEIDPALAKRLVEAELQGS